MIARGLARFEKGMGTVVTGPFLQLSHFFSKLLYLGGNTITCQ
jgi:hypothetical protein